MICNKHSYQQDCATEGCLCCALQSQLAAAQEDKASAIASVVTTVGGTDNEGNPTSSINYLQRLRELVIKEDLFADAMIELALAKEANSRLQAEVERLDGLLEAISNLALFQFNGIHDYRDKVKTIAARRKEK